MRLKAIIIFSLLSALGACPSFGQAGKGFTQSRILILLDESSSMLHRWSGGKEKNKIANELVLKLMDSVWAFNDQVEFSLRVFGSQSTVPEHNCTDTRNEVPFTKQNRTQMEFRLDDIRPLGVTSIAYSLSEAAEKDLVDEDHNAYSIVLITDGGESCGGDICGVMEKLLRRKIFFKPYIISLEAVPELKNEYSCMGNYLQVTQKSDLPVAVGAIVEAFRPMLNISKEDYKILQRIGAPSVLKVNLPSVKTEKIKDIPEVVKPVIKPADTITTVKKPEPKTSNITVGEAIKIPAPVKMTRVINTSQRKLYVAATPAYRPKYISIPELKIPEPELPPTLPAPLKMTAAVVKQMKKLNVNKSLAYEPASVAVNYEINVKVPEPPPAAPVPFKMERPELTAIKKYPVAKVAAFTPVAVGIMYEVKVKAPEPVAVAPVAFKMNTVAFSAVVRPSAGKTAKYVPLTLPPVTYVINVPPPPVVPVAPTAVKMKQATPTAVKRYVVNKPANYRPETIAVTVPLIKLPEPPPPPPPVVVKQKDVFARLKVRKPHMPMLFTLDFYDTKLNLVKLPPPPKLKPIVPATVATPPQPPKPKMPNPAVNTAEYSVTQEDAKETTLMVYITNGKGKYFQVTPQITLTDAVTGKEVKKFTRFVDAAGNPDPLSNLAAGKYYLTITGREDLVASVDLLPNKRTRVEIVTKKYSLSFYYFGAPKRPVEEFTAIVTQRNTTNGKIVTQKCAEKKEYEPGNYHISINTFPEDVRNTDIDETLEHGIGIAQPGFAKFTAEGKTTKFTLQKQDGDKFISFAVISLSDPATRHLQIQPGKYQVVYSNGVTQFSTSDRVVAFQIKSNEETEVILKQ